MGSAFSILIGCNSILNNGQTIEMCYNPKPPYYIFEESIVIKITRCKFIDSNNLYNNIGIGSFRVGKGESVKMIIDDPTNIKLQVGGNIINFPENSIKDKYKIFIPFHSKYKKVM